MKKSNKINELGFMLDCSRGAVLNVESVKKLVDYLKAFNYTYLMLYTEDTYEIEGEPYFGYMRGRYSVSEIKEIDRYCIEKGIELRACIQTLAHLSRIIRHKDYSNLFDIDNILLVDDDKTYELIDKMLKAISTTFTSKNVHIGMDEAWRLGRGKYQDIHGAESRGSIMKKHFDKVVKLTQKYGFNCYMWGDMLVNAYNDDKENYNLEIPENITPLMWKYWPVGIENCSKEFDVYDKITNHKYGYAGGAHKWSGFVPCNRFSIAAMSEQIEVCKMHNVNHFLLTAWGDGAAECSVFSVLPAIFMAYVLSNNLELNDSTKAYFKEVTTLDFDKFMLADKLNEIDPNHDYTGQFNTLSFTHFYNDLLQDLICEDEYEESKEQYLAIKKMYEPLLDNNEFGYLFNMMHKLADFLSIKSALGLHIYNAYKKNDKKALKNCIKEIKIAIKKLDVFKLASENVWHKENKSFGYEKMVIRYGGLKERLLYTIRRIEAYLKGNIKVIEELEEKRLPSDTYISSRPREDREFNCYKLIVSSGTLEEI